MNLFTPTGDKITKTVTYSILALSIVLLIIEIIVP